MLRAILTALLIAVAAPAAAGARLVYHRAGTHKIVAARDDGTHRRVIGRGIDAQIAPNGHHALLKVTRGGGNTDIRIASTRKRMRTRVLLRGALFGFRNLGGRPVWSPDSRYVVAADGTGFVYLINARTRRRRDLNAGAYGSGSFSPDGSRIALDLGDPVEDSGDVWLYGRKSKRFSNLHYPGTLLTWGGGGFAYYDFNGLQLRAGPRRRARRLMEHPADQTVKPVDWSHSGRRLLAEIEADEFGPKRAVLITPSTGAIHTLPNSFSDVADLSRNGKRVLGVVDGDVVSVRPDGTARVLARNADRPSWNR